MGYNLGIGEFEVESCAEERWARGSCKFHEGIESAPLDSSGAEDSRVNWIYPGYATWGTFTQRVRLNDVFYPARPSNEPTPWEKERDPLLDAHPGAVALTVVHLKRFELALAEYVVEPGDVNGKGVNYARRRLEWLVFWTDWALKNCKFPTFVNT